MTIASRKRTWLATAAMTITLTAAFAFTVTPVSAEEHGRDHRDYHHRGPDAHYYHGPPIVYGSPYYFGPPLIYGPGLSINIR